MGIRCPTEAFGHKVADDSEEQADFGGGGGLTYELLRLVRRRLQEYCNPDLDLSSLYEQGNDDTEDRLQSCDLAY